ncbi:MAG TPA: NAD(+) diphosphatase [Rhodobacterales bacterium]|nr:NAD(+) diphosphatase [Rhodobacterales bacterium]
MRKAETVTLAGGLLERQAHRRADSAALLADPRARVLPMWRGRPLVTGGVIGGEDRPVSLALCAVDDSFVTAHASLWVFLGEALPEDAGEGTSGPLFAADLSAWQPDDSEIGDAGPGRTAPDVPAPAQTSERPDARFADLRGLISTLAPGDGEIAATARGILEWHRSHGFCAACGSATNPVDAGWRRVCLSCGTSHFPRTDPVVIMLVTAGNKALIGRSPGWPEGFYSALAGFMEPGETIAAAVRREVMEEAGVTIGAVRLLTSQPWPFPASLMIGCAAQATSTEITLDDDELEDALWLTREELLGVFAGQHERIAAPREGAIAHFLLKMWLADTLD